MTKGLSAGILCVFVSIWRVLFFIWEPRPSYQCPLQLLSCPQYNPNHQLLKHLQNRSVHKKDYGIVERLSWRVKKLVL